MMKILEFKLIKKHIKGDRMLFSIVIPIYNTEKYLENCIISVLNQTYKDFEVLLINDGSTDGSGEICEKFASKDNRIKVIHKNNSGVSSARNKGIDNASGDYIIFVDSDDIVNKELLDTVFKQINKNNCDIVSYRFDKKNSNNEDNVIEFTALNKVEIKLKFNDIYEVGVGSVCTQAYNLNMLKLYNIYFNNEIALNEEVFFNLKCFEVMKSFEFINKVLYKYNENLNSSSRKGDINYLDIVKEKVLVYDRFLEKMGYKDIVSYTPKKMLQNDTYAYFLQAAISTNQLTYKERIKILRRIYKNDDDYKNLRNAEYFKVTSINLLICKLSAMLKLPFIIATLVSVKKYYNKLRYNIKKVY